MDNKETLILAEQVIRQLVANKLYITTVESCTGGGLACYLTNIPGASEALKDSFVTYSNEAKIALGVPADIIERFGVYSKETAVAMAEAGLVKSVRADIAVGITGKIIESKQQGDSKVSLIYIAVVCQNENITEELKISPLSRPEIKEEIIQVALKIILKMLK